MSNKGTLKKIEEQALSWGIHKELPDGVMQKVYWWVACGGCNSKVMVPAGPNTSPQLMVRNMRKKGWDLREGKAPKCPSCAHPRKENDMNEEMKKAVHDAVVSSPIAVAGKIMRGVYSLLEEFFDTNTMLYKGGWTDAKVAKEVGTAESVVIKIREEAYGKLAEDPEITTLKDDLQLLSIELADTFRKFSERLDAFRSRADRLAAGRKV